MKWLAETKDVMSTKSVYLISSILEVSLDFFNFYNSCFVWVVFPSKYIMQIRKEIPACNFVKKTQSQSFPVNSC